MPSITYELLKMSPLLIIKKIISEPHEKNFATNLNKIKKAIKGKIALFDFNDKAVIEQLCNFLRSARCNNRGHPLWHTHATKGFLEYDIGAKKHIGRTLLSKQKAEVFGQAERNRTHSKNHLKQ